MKEQLQQAVQKLIDKGVSGIESGVDFLQQEIPDYVMQLLMWHGVYNFILMAISIFGLLLWVVIEVKLFKKLETMDLSEQDWIFGHGMLGSIVRIVPFVIVCANMNLEWLKIWIAPKVWLVEYAASLVK